MIPTLETYIARRGPFQRKRHRWRLLATNGRIIAVSSDGYNNLADLMRGVEVAREALFDPPASPKTGVPT